MRGGGGPEVPHRAVSFSHHTGVVRVNFSAKRSKLDSGLSWLWSSTRHVDVDKPTLNEVQIVDGHQSHHMSNK